MDLQTKTLNNIKIDFQLDLKRFFEAILIVFLLLLLMNISVIYLFREYNLVDYGFYRLFFFDEEANISTFFNSMLLIMGGLSFLYIGNYYSKSKNESPHNEFKLQWILFGLLLIFIGLDDFSQIHEYVGAYVGRKLNSGGIFFFAWVIPAFFILIGITLYFFRFVKNLPPKTRSSIIFSAVIFITGGLGLEMIGSHYFYNYGGDSTVFALIATVEEILEKSGAILFLRTALFHLKEIQAGNKSYI